MARYFNFEAHSLSGGFRLSARGFRLSAGGFQPSASVINSSTTSIDYSREVLGTHRGVPPKSLECDLLAHLFGRCLLEEVSDVGITFAGTERMSRDHTKLRFFATADHLTLRVYRLTESLPATERYGLQSQMRRAAVSAVTNIVEGACRRTDKAYSQFLEIALGSASEVRYLLELSARLQLLKREAAEPLVVEYSIVVKGLQALITTIARSEIRN